MKFALTLALFFLPLLAEAANPIITDTFTADPAAMVYRDTVYLYAGQDEAKPNENRYVMNRWVCFSSKDMKTWTPLGSPLAVKDFAWVARDAWASQVIERDGKFFWYVAVSPADRALGGKAIGVAVSDSPAGPFEDARGTPLVTDKMTYGALDPTVFMDDDGQAYLCWGNPKCYYAKLAPNMIELGGPITEITGLPDYTEAPWMHKHWDTYYLSYASGFPERISYATAPKITGPWTLRGILADLAGNSNTIHQAIIEFKGQSYFIYHNGGIQRPNSGGSYRRSVCVDYLYYNQDGTIKRVVQSVEGTDLPPVQDRHAATLR